MVCNPNDNTINISAGPPFPLPGLGIPFSPPQLPFPDFELPEGIPEDILDLIDQILANLPGGLLKPNPDNFMKDVLDAIASLLNQIAPYLALYRFFQALLNVILCIIDVLCALMNPFKLYRAIRKLFKRCLPDFLNLFPWLALIAMIIALLLLLLALIQYLIDRIRELIEQIIRNLEILVQGVQLDDEEATLAAIRKIAYLLCLIEQLFAILIAFQAILAIIEALLQTTGRSVCGRSGSTSGDDSECCGEDVCPNFIAEQPDGFEGVQGRLIYNKTLFNDLSGLRNLGINLELDPLREQRWQFLDLDSTKTFLFRDIITPIDDGIFWPDGISFELGSSLKKTPYILDMTLELDPAVFGHDDTGGSRPFVINDILVVEKPFIGVIRSNGVISSLNPGEATGTLLLEGGKVYEEDGTTPFLVGGGQATLNGFIFQPSSVVTTPILFDDGYIIDNIEYNLRINHQALIGYSLITLGCPPEIAVESELFNSTQDVSSVFDKIGALPNVGTLSPKAGAVGCLDAALTNFRNNISPESAAVFQASVETCLNDLRDETLETYKKAVCAGTDPFKTDYTLTPDIQFVAEPIIVSIELKDIGGNIISGNVPSDVEDEIAAKLSAEVTFGKISDFSFDGYQAFVAEITAEEEGSGQITVSFDGNILSLIINRDDDDIATEIIENVKSYQFVGVLVKAADDLEGVRRDESDVARSG